MTAFGHPADQESPVARGRSFFLYFYALEDLVARKLLWFRLRGEVSERQWRDVLGMLRLNRCRVDLQRLGAVAMSAAVSDLLETALQEAGADDTSD